MKILIDASCLMKELTGIGVYTRNLMEALIPLDPEAQYTLLMNAAKGPTPSGFIRENANARIVRRRIPGKLLLESWRRYKWPQIEWLSGTRSYDLFHSPNFIYQPSGIERIVATVHDLAFIKRTDYGSRYSGRYHRDTLRQNLARANRIVAVSDTVKSDIQQLFSIDPDRIRVIHHGLHRRFMPADDIPAVKQRLQKQGYPASYILSVGTIEARKNYPVLIEAFSRFSRLHPHIPLIIAGQFAGSLKDVERRIRQLKLENKVILPGYVAFETLTDLYNGADLAVFPSWEEGFGFPPLEAAACGAPVLASDIPAHREMLGDSIVYFHPEDRDGLSHQLVRMIEDETMTADIRRTALEKARSYTWDAAAKRHLEVYQEVVRE
ncbi:glycosyltransferase family 4 protein [bacterium]|nr:glycosyltransferase family 4 protein [candidate division CSSED10-310 bacterium]